MNIWKKMNYASMSSPAIGSSKQHAQPNISNIPLNDQLENPILFKVPLDPKEWNGDKAVQNDQNTNNHHESFHDESFQMLMEHKIVKIPYCGS